MFGLIFINSLWYINIRSDPQYCLYFCGLYTSLDKYIGIHTRQNENVLNHFYAETESKGDEGNLKLCQEEKYSCT